MGKKENHMTTRLLAILLTLCLLIQICPVQPVRAQEAAGSSAESAENAGELPQDEPVDPPAESPEPTASQPEQVPETSEPEGNTLREDLTAAAADADSRLAEDYTDESWQLLQTALTQAKLVLDAEEATQEELETALLDLQTALSQLEEFVPADRTYLIDAVAEAESLNPDDYTQEDWAVVVDALAQAKAALEKERLSQQEADEAFTALQAAMAITIPAEAATYVLADSGVTYWNTGDGFPTEIPSGATVKLTANISLGADQQLTLIAGTLDGQGHTITLENKSLAQEVTGTVQNLIVAASGSIGGTSGYPSNNGAIATKLTGGTIRSCMVTAAMTSLFDDNGGLAGISVGGTIRNSVFAGSAPAKSFGGLIGASQDTFQPSSIHNSYYAGVGIPVCAGNAYNEGGVFGQKSITEMQTAEFVELLNTGIASTGYVWASSNGGLPILQKAGETKPDVPTPGTVDTSRLEAAIAEADGIEKGNHTDVSWETLQNALTAARAALAEEGLTQEQADTAESELRTAMAALQEKPADPLANLKALVADAEKLQQADYTAETWEPFSLSLQDARDCIERAEENPQIIGETYADLQGAIERLDRNPEPDTDPLAELKTLVAEAKALKQEDYTPESWEPFSYNLQDAEACIQRNESDPEMIGYAVSDLKQGMAGLQKAEKPQADPLAELKALVAECKALKQDDYTPDTWGPFAEMLGDAEAAIKRNEQDAEIIGFTLQDLKDAKGRLQKAEKPQADPLAELKALVAEAKQLKQEDYTPESWEPFSYNLQDAEGCIQRNETDPEMIGYAVNDLKQGMAGLQKAGNPEPADPMQKLKELVAEIKALNPEDYTTETWGRVAMNLEDAERAIQSGATDSADAIYEELKAAKDALQEKPAAAVDTAKLQAALDQAKTLKEGDYTDTTWGNLQIAVMMGESAIKKAGLTQQEADKAEKDITDAIAALQKKPDPKSLQQTIDEAKALQKDDYTAESWAVMQEKLKLAEDAVIYLTSQEALDKAEEALHQAIRDLKPAAAEPSGPVVTVSTPDQMPDTIPAGTTVVLANSITLDRQITQIAGTLDGHGFTITLSDKAMAQEVTGRVQNLIVAASGTIGGAPGYPSNNGAIATRLSGGQIFNCMVTAAVNSSILNENGGLVGVSVGGTIRNSVFAGPSTYAGLIGASQDSSQPSAIHNSYYAGVNKPVSAGNAYNEDGVFGKKSLTEMKTAGFVTLLNKGIQPTGYIWQAADGGLPVLVPGSIEVEPDTPKVDKTDLLAVIADAETYNAEDYTEATWAAVDAALVQAYAVRDDEKATQDQVNQAQLALTEAVSKLERALAAKPVELSSDAIEVTDLASFGMLFEPSDTKGKHYKLMNDVEIPAGWFAIYFAGVLDGQGHTITFVESKNGVSPLFMEILPGAVIQNVHFAGSKANGSAPVTDSLQGSIVNCRSSFTGPSGLVKELKGGVIANCLVMGQPKAALASKYIEGQVLNTYWSDRLGNSVPGSALTDSAAKSDKVLKTTATRDLLNAGRGAFGTAWGQGSDGYPYFGADQPYTPEGEFQAIYPVVYKMPDESLVRIGEDNKLTLNPDNGRNAGFFTLEGVPSDSTISWSCEDNNNNNTMAINLSTGEYFVFQTGDAVVRATEHTADGQSRKVAEIVVTSAYKSIAELHLIAGGQDVTNGTYTVAGSAVDRVTVSVRYEGEEKLTPVKKGFTFTTDKVDTMILQQSDSGAFSFARPGTATMTVTRGNLKASVDITSTYVPVEEIWPSVDGRNELHGKNSMYPDYNTLETQVYFKPENASYTKDYQVVSSDEEIAIFSTSLPLGYIPKKAGNVTFTASVVNKDPITGQESTVSGSHDVTFFYKNPLKEVTGPTEPINITAFEPAQPFTLNYVGTAPIPEGYNYPYAVTETRLNWTFEGSGEVEITYPNKVMQVRGDDHPDGGEWVSNTQYYVRGLGEGTVIATGTPVDDTAGAKPVVVTFEVAPGEAPEPFDIPGFIREAMSASIPTIKASLTDYQYSDEWKIYDLIRAGETIAPENLDLYYQNVQNEVSSWKATRKPTDIARVMLAVAIAGKDVSQVVNKDGISLPAMLYNHKYLMDGSNEVTWALIALDAQNTPIPQDAKWSRDSLVEALLTFQNADGGFGLGPNTSSGVDTTSMALQALAPYQGRADVAAAVENAIGYLKTQHNKTNHFDSGNSEANAQTIIALSVLGRDLANDPDFTSSLYNLMTAMNEYFVSGQGFMHEKGTKVNAMATVQALQAVDAYNRFAKGQSGYWTLPEKEPVPDYGFISGQDQHKQNGTAAEKTSMRINAAFSEFQAVYVDDVLLDPSLYTASEGSTVIVLSAGYIRDLEPGLHRIRVEFTGGKSETTLTIEAVDEAVLNVEALIDAIGTVNKESGEKIEAARKAYDALSQEQQKKVSNYDKLTAAEKAFGELGGTVIGKAVLTVERFTIGQGFFMEPAYVDVMEGDTVSKLLTRVLGDKASIRDEGNYLQYIVGADTGSAVIPQYIAESSGGKCTTESVMNYYNERGKDKWDPGDLGEFTYSLQSGWMYHMNGIAPGVGIGETHVSDGDVIRIQHTVYNLGRDVEVGNAGVTNKDALLRTIAQVKTEPENILSNAGVKTAMKNALDAACDMVLPDEDVKAAADALLQAVENAGKPAHEIVMDLISQLPVPVGLADKASVEAARAAYDALTDEEKALVKNLNVLEAAEARLKAIEAQKPGKVIFSVERFTLGQGFFTEPRQIELKQGETVDDLLQKTVGAENLQKNEQWHYLTGIKGADLGAAATTIPQYITAMGGPTTEAAREFRGQGASDALKEGLYSTASGWTFFVNNAMPPVGMQDCLPSDGDVIRIQYTVHGYGQDVSGMDWEGNLLQAIFSKDALYRAMAQHNGAAQAVREDAAVKQAYAAAVKAAADVITSQEELETARQNLLDAMANVDVQPEDFLTRAQRMTSEKLLAEVTTQFGGENDWVIFTLLRRGQTIPKNTLNAYYANVEAAVSKWPDTQKPTDIARIILPLSMMGKDITNVGGKNLPQMLYNHKYLLDGSNELIWALIALDANGTAIPEDARWFRSEMTAELLAMQNPDGGFPLFAGTGSDVDITAMALQALAQHQDLPGVKDASAKAWKYLKDRFNGTLDAGSLEAAAQTVLALSVSGRDLASEPGLISADKNLLTTMEDYFLEENAFTHNRGGEYNLKSSWQGLQALDAYARLLSGDSSYWRLSGAIPADPQRPVPDADQQAADQVVDQINKLPAVDKLKKEDKTAVEAARKAYNDLTDSQKGLITADVLKKLTDAEAQIQKLTEGGNKPSGGGGGGSAAKKITVKFELWGDKTHGRDGQIHTYHPKNTLTLWVPAKDIEVETDATVLDVFTKGVGKLPFINKGNYISDINGLAEFTNGPKSGWMYMLNGVYPDLGVEQQKVKDGDHIIFHYTDDYTQEDSNYKPGDDAENDDTMTPKKVIELIDAIGTVTKDSGEKIEAARKAYDSLKPEQKKLVTNYDKLVAAEKKLAELNATEEDKKAAKKVEELIDALDPQDADYPEKVREARKAYDALTDLQKKLVSNYDKLLEAEKQLGDAAKDHYKKVGDYFTDMAQKQAPVPGVIGGEWMVIGLARSGREVPEAYYDSAVAYVQQSVNDKQQLHPVKSTENSRMILGLTAIGRDVTDVAGHNLLMGLTDMEYVRTQGINGPIWALIAFDSARYEIPQNPDAKEQVSREALIDEILAAQLSDGGWTLNGDKADPDMTGMALQALAPYCEKNDKVSAAAQKGVDCLSKMQNEDGTFSNGTKITCEASAQVIVALTAMGIDPAKDQRFVKKDGSALDGLMKFAAENGFSHLLDMDQDPMATEQGYYALTAYFRFREGKTSIYDMTDVEMQHVHFYTWKFLAENGAVKAVGLCSCGEKSEMELEEQVLNSVHPQAALDNWMGARLNETQILPALELSNTEFKALMEGGQMDVVLNAEDAAATILPQDLQLIQQAVPEDLQFVVLDITLAKQLDAGRETLVLNTQAPVSITLDIPQELQKRGRIYSMYALHNGVVSEIPVEVDPETMEATFETDHFSHYVLSFEDPGLGLNGWLIIGSVSGLALLGVAGIVIYLCLRKKKPLM